MNATTMSQSSHFLQSPEWAAFQSRVGHTPIEVERVQAYTHKVGIFTYAYIPHAPYIDDTVCDALAKKGFQWIRLEGGLAETVYKTYEGRGRQPQTTLILDIGPSHEEILQQMHPKTRYNIRLAERKGVTVQRKKDVDIFWNLNEETTMRDEFSGHRKSYYEKFLAMDMADQFTAYYQGVPIASIITVTHGDTTTYVHGASSNALRNLMAPYLLQWYAMLYGKSKGATRYDFWGIAPVHPQGTHKKETCYNGYCWDVTHPWTGITRFKVGFGGDVVTYPDTIDILLNPKSYTLYRIIYRLRYGR